MQESTANKIAMEEYQDAMEEMTKHIGEKKEQYEGEFGFLANCPMAIYER